MGKSTNQPPSKEDIALVFKTLTELKSKARHDKNSISLNDLRKAVPQRLSD